MISFLLASSMALSQAPVVFPNWSEAPVVAEVSDTKKPTLVLLSLPGCAPCKVMKLRLLRLNKRRVNYITEDLSQWNEKQTNPAMKSNSAPTIFVWDVNGKVYKFVGLSTLKQLEASLFAKKKQPAAKIASYVRGSGRGQWTWPGGPSVSSLERHLSGPPHYFDAASLKSMSDRQLINLHDSLHNSGKLRKTTTRLRAG